MFSHDILVVDYLDHLPPINTRTMMHANIKLYCSVVHFSQSVKLGLCLWITWEVKNMFFAFLSDMYSNCYMFKVLGILFVIYLFRVCYEAYSTHSCKQSLTLVSLTWSGKVFIATPPPPVLWQVIIRVWCHPYLHLGGERHCES